jgi:hypothetical protein
MTTGNQGSDGSASQFQNHLPPHPEPITSSHSVRLVVGQPEMKKVGMNYRAIMDDGAAEARKGAPCQLAEFDGKETSRQRFLLAASPGLQAKTWNADDFYAL